MIVENYTSRLERMRENTNIENRRAELNNLLHCVGMAGESLEIAKLMGRRIKALEKDVMSSGKHDEIEVARMCMELDEMDDLIPEEDEEML